MNTHQSGTLSSKDTFRSHHCLWENHQHAYRKDFNRTLGYQVTSHRGHLIMFLLGHNINTQVKKVKLEDLAFQYLTSDRSGMGLYATKWI